MTKLDVAASVLKPRASFWKGRSQLHSEDIQEFIYAAAESLQYELFAENSTREVTEIDQMVWAFIGEAERLKLLASADPKRAQEILIQIEWF